MKKFYVEIFQVTETLQNGKERRVKKEVLSPVFNNGKHIPEKDRINAAVKLLEENHYYNIEHLETKARDVLMLEF